jgi:hypothetical protein
MLAQYLLSGNVETFSIELSQALMYSNVSGKKWEKNAKSFYHAACLGMFLHAREQGCEVQSEGTAGEGHFDFFLVPPPNADFYAVKMKLKILQKGETLEHAAEDSLEQLSSTNYTVGIPQNVTKLLEIAIAFQGKLSKVAFKKYVKVAKSWRDE